jgi:hypothetical protein
MWDSGDILLFLGQGQEAAFLSAVTVGSGTVSNTITIPLTSFSAGQLLHVFILGRNLTPATPSGWTFVGSQSPASGSVGFLYSKTLTSGDISAGSVTFSNADGHGVALAYANQTGAAIRTSGHGTNTDSLSVPGFTLASNSAGVVILAQTNHASAPLAAPSLGGIALRAGPSNYATYGTVAAWDFTTPGDYPEAALTFSGFVDGSENLYALELLK